MNGFLRVNGKDIARFSDIEGAKRLFDAGQGVTQNARKRGETEPDVDLVDLDGNSIWNEISEMLSPSEK